MESEAAKQMDRLPFHLCSSPLDAKLRGSTQTARVALELDRLTAA